MPLDCGAEAPSFTRFRPASTFKDGDANVTLECGGVGDPVPTVQWLRMPGSTVVPSPALPNYVRQACRHSNGSKAVEENSRVIACGMTLWLRVVHTATHAWLLGSHILAPVCGSHLPCHLQVEHHVNMKYNKCVLIVVFLVGAASDLTLGDKTPTQIALLP